MSRDIDRWDPRVILLDYDGRVPAKFLARLRWVLNVAVATRPVWVRQDRTRNGWHITVGIGRRLSPVRVVLVQALMGSDWRRETFNARRVARLPYVAPLWRSRWNVLYDCHFRSVRV